jgi:hypothetical protein
MTIYVCTHTHTHAYICYMTAYRDDKREVAKRGSLEPKP